MNSSNNKKNITDKLSNPEWRLGIIFLFLLLFLYFWGQLLAVRGPTHHKINYSMFIEQLDIGNVNSVTIKELQVNGEFFEEVNIILPGRVEPTPVRFFQTLLPSFQGENILLKLEEKRVLINVEPSEKISVFWQFLLGLLPGFSLSGYGC